MCIGKRQYEAVCFQWQNGRHPNCVCVLVNTAHILGFPHLADVELKRKCSLGRMVANERGQDAKLRSVYMHRHYHRLIQGG